MQPSVLTRAATMFKAPILTQTQTLSRGSLNLRLTAPVRPTGWSLTAVPRLTYATRSARRAASNPFPATSASSSAFAETSAEAMVPKLCLGQRFREFKEKCKFDQGVQQKWATGFREPVSRHLHGIKDKTWEEYPMPQIRAHHTAVVGPGQPDVATNLPLLQSYLQQYKNQHNGSLGGFMLLAMWVGFASIGFGSMAFMECVFWPFLMYAIPINLSLWYKTWYHSTRETQVGLKLVTVEHQIKAAVAAATPTASQPKDTNDKTA